MSRWRVALLVLLIAAMLALARAAGMERAGLVRPERWYRDLVAGLTGAITRATDGLEPLWGAWTRYRALAAENESLRAEVGRLTEENSRLEEYRRENVRLKRLLRLKEEFSGYDLLAARVVGRHPDTWYRTVIIDRGSADGVARNMPVIAYEGLVGRVMAVSERSSEVLLLTDQEAAVGALLQASRIPAVVRGTGDVRGRLQLVHLPYDAPVRPNQVVLTSGLGGSFPRGLRIGYVVEVVPEANGLMKRAVVQTFVDFTRLEEVMVIRRFGGG